MTRFLILALSLNLFSGGQKEDFGYQLAEAAYKLTRQEVVYDPSYFNIDYPMGDVPANKGVCTDVVIRAYRSLGIDLQELVHQDMSANFPIYPKNWNLSKPDPNIDHRRVPNLMCFFNRFAESLPASKQSRDYRPGDIVCWNLGGGILHIGIVSAYFNSDHRPLIVHNIGAGQELEDMLFDYQIIGHYRYQPSA